MTITTPSPHPRPSGAPLPSDAPPRPSGVLSFGPLSFGRFSSGRRNLLLGGGAAAGAALLAGCSGDSGSRPDASGSRSDEERLRTRGARDSAALLARYDATADVHPRLADRLGPLREETARHLEAFRSADRPASASASASPSASASGGKARAADVPKDEKQALTALARAERRTADARTAALRDAPPELARLLASVAACGAAHAYLLTAGGS
ncbi:hypothetical protein ACH4S9_42315 [Streptomyces sp. NPDC021225]|uniref:hypothetical protein n=1 Tax=Streptomyces sp. NPDC021225 TaxID=3365121 RepID=UPI00378A1E06